MVLTLLTNSKEFKLNNTVIYVKNLTNGDDRYHPITENELNGLKEIAAKESKQGLKAKRILELSKIN